MDQGQQEKGVTKEFPRFEKLDIVVFQETECFGESQLKVGVIFYRWSTGRSGRLGGILII